MFRVSRSSVVVFVLNQHLRQAIGCPDRGGRDALRIEKQVYQIDHIAQRHLRRGASCHAVGQIPSRCAAVPADQFQTNRRDRKRGALRPRVADRAIGGQLTLCAHRSHRRLIEPHRASNRRARRGSCHVRAPHWRYGWRTPVVRTRRGEVQMARGRTRRCAAARSSLVPRCAISATFRRQSSALSQSLQQAGKCAISFPETGGAKGRGCTWSVLLRAALWHCDRECRRLIPGVLTVDLWIAAAADRPGNWAASGYRRRFPPLFRVPFTGCCASAISCPLRPSSLGLMLSSIHFWSHHSTGSTATPSR